MNTTKRVLTDHILNGLNEALKITVLDTPGAGGASHRYEIRTVIPLSERDPTSSSRSRACCDIHFQNGGIQEAGVNGISGEALMAVQIDRLRSFQAGPYACYENAQALAHLETSLMWLQKRTRDRLARGVEGKLAA